MNRSIQKLVRDRVGLRKKIMEEWMIPEWFKNSNSALENLENVALAEF